MTPPFLRGARAATIFLTRIPVGGFPFSRDDLAWACGWFPAIGAGLGLLLSLVWQAVQGHGLAVAALSVVGTSLLLTGALHEDGLADTADALGGGRTPERVFAILKDSRVGTLGAAALFLSLGLRAALLVRLGTGVPAALVLAESLSRLGPALLLSILPYVTPDETAKSRGVARAGVGQVILALGLATAVLSQAVARGAIDAGAAARVAAAALVLPVLCGWYFNQRVRGLTGDFLGATQQIAYVGVLLSLA